MFSPTFDWIFAGIMAVLAVIFFLGKGRGILNAFAGRNNSEAKKKKRTPEEELRYQRAFAYFLTPLAISEVMMALIGYTYVWVPFMTMAVVVVSMVLLILYLRKNFPE